MKKLVSGIHHISLNTSSDAEYARVKDFYAGVLGLTVRAEWPTGCMLDTGSGIVEVINNRKAPLPQGVIRHVAFAVEDPDACAAAAAAAGYEILTAPKDVTIAATPALPIRIAFCRGPLGEEVEFFALR